METLLILCALGVLAVQIWLIVLFVRMSDNVKSIFTIIQNQFGLPTISFNEALLGKILHKEDETYEKVVRKLFHLLDSYSRQAAMNDVTEDAKQAICLANDMCLVLGRQLPEQLSSFESFKKFIKEAAQLETT